MYELQGWCTDIISPDCNFYTSLIGFHSENIQRLCMYVQYIAHPRIRPTTTGNMLCLCQHVYIAHEKHCHVGARQAGQAAVQAC